MAGFAIPLITAGISGLAGLFGNRKAARTGTDQTDITNNSSTQANSSTTHNFTGEQKTLVDQIMQSIAGQKPFDASGYTANGLQSINSGADALQRSLKNTIAARGLSFSPAGFNPLAQAESGRIAQQNQFLETIPQVQQQYDTTNLENTLKAFGVMPTDSSTTGTSATNSTGSSDRTYVLPGSGVAGALGGVGSALATPYNADGDTGLESILNSLGIK